MHKEGRACEPVYEFQVDKPWIVDLSSWHLKYSSVMCTLHGQGWGTVLVVLHRVVGHLKTGEDKRQDCLTVGKLFLFLKAEVVIMIDILVPYFRVIMVDCSFQVLNWLDYLCIYKLVFPFRFFLVPHLAWFKRHLMNSCGLCKVPSSRGIILLRSSLVPETRS